MRLAKFIGAAVLIVGQPVFAQTFTDWDADGDGTLTRSEWDTGVTDSDLFGNWDANDDGTVSAVEYEDGLFDLFDDDDNGALSIAEWDEGVDSWYGEARADFEVSAWDDDGDGTITEEEFNDEFTTAGLFDDFTTDAGIETVEIEGGDAVGVRENDFFAGLFDWFDADDDTGIVADEAGWFG
ncbi:hypothetical protein [Jannaschia formosa]|uniref:hypothetical protein n=1 Tax=Jannaschia formosa TaxID=2259592 RepID=UPI000E1B8B76|nr:hypothetical protein [Jannaschia formosa]TFL17241.1 hypothetical protein DR046_15540 [Jannaschia formosa]